MKKIVVGIILLVGVMGFVDPNIFYEDKMASFKWLIGSWAMNSKNELIVETWIPMSDSIIEGESMKFNKKTSETVPLEKMRLICRNKEFFYIPMKEGQQNNQPVEFKIISFSKKGFTAVNQAHDFPKRIIYDLFKKDSLHAFIDAGPGKKVKRVDYYYARTKRSTPPPVKK